MLERKDSGNNVQCVEKNNPEWPDTSQKTPGSFYPDQAKNSYAKSHTHNFIEIVNFIH